MILIKRYRYSLNQSIGQLLAKCNIPAAYYHCQNHQNYIDNLTKSYFY
jgi:hypothetical protein